jgi:hypothetical protein
VAEKYKQVVVEGRGKKKELVEVLRPLPDFFFPGKNEKKSHTHAHRIEAEK